MRIAGSASVLTKSEVELIHGAILRILSEVGVCIENETILSRLGEAGAEIDMGEMNAKFSPAFVEGFIAESDKFDWDNVKPHVACSAGIFEGPYLDPETDEYVPWTEERVRRHAKLAHYLENVDHAAMLGCPVEGVDRRIIPLIQRRMCWKNGLLSGGSIWDTRLCDYIIEMCEVMADEKGKQASDYVRGMVFFTSTLKLPASEAEQFVYFAEKGFKVTIDSMTSAGGSAPVTLAGAVAVHLCQVLASAIIWRVFYGTKDLHLSSTIAPYDMRTLIYAYGRPERQIANLMVADMAKHYGVSASGHGGHTDAKRPGPEAGAQKALTTIPTLMGCGSARVGAGYLSIDEMGCPVQMVIDNEFVGALRRFAAGCEINEETLAVDLVKEVGPGGLFMDRMHTAEHFRSELWEPKIWSREMFSGWLASGAKTALDKALEGYHEIMAMPDLPPGISDDTDKRLGEIMERAAAALD